MMKKILTLAIAALMGVGVMAQSSINTIRDVTSRTNFAFHWGFNNWGADQLSGLSGMSDPAYDLRTSFSSYQLSMSYSVVKTKRIEASLGVGYESDVYKYNTPHVGFATSDFVQLPSSGDKDEATKLCTRYATLPLGVAFNSGNGDFKVRLSAIPGLGFSGKHTGLKYDNGSNVAKTDLKDALNPYKLDLRVDLLFGGVGVFLQVATMPLLNDNIGKNVYPIKFGFVI